MLTNVTCQQVEPIQVSNSTVKKRKKGYTVRNKY